MLFFLTYLFFLTGIESHDFQENKEPDLVVECKVAPDWKRRTYEACSEEPHSIVIDFKVKNIISGDYFYDIVSVFVSCPKQKFETGILELRKINTLRLVKSELIELNEFHKTDSAKYIYRLL